ncbi:MAG: AN1-type zinc finger protein [Haloarculaceae archaeon]
MVDECASCEADDELLFTCSYCDEQFCSTHQFPHHACEGFGRAAEAGDPAGPEADPTASEADPAAPATVTPPEPSARAESLSAGSWGGSGSLPVETGDGVVNVRPMDSHRVVGGTEASAAPRTVGDWIGRQTYLTLLVKVGVIALLINAAFYGGMAVTLYGLLPFAL